MRARCSHTTYIEVEQILQGNVQWSDRIAHALTGRYAICKDGRSIAGQAHAHMVFFPKESTYFNESARKDHLYLDNMCTLVCIDAMLRIWTATIVSALAIGCMYRSFRLPDNPSCGH